MYFICTYVGIFIYESRQRIIYSELSYRINQKIYVALCFKLEQKWTDWCTLNLRTFKRIQVGFCIFLLLYLVSK